jgi:hypothetical protein
MANPDSPFGLKPVGMLDGNPWNGSVRRVQAIATYDTAMFIGDPVIWTGDSDATGQCPIVEVATAGATNNILGVMVAWEPDSYNTGYTYRPAKTLRFGWMVPAKNVIFEVQACSGAVLALGTVGLNADLIATHSGSTATGLSGFEMDSGATTAPAADATYQLTVVGFVKRANNSIAAVNGNWLVTINLPSISAAIAGV